MYRPERAVREAQAEAGHVGSPGAARRPPHRHGLNGSDWRACKKAQQIDEVTPLANDATSADLRVLRPVPG